MSTDTKIVVVVTNARGPHQAALVRWVRWLLPAALLVVAPTSFARVDVARDSDEVITLDGEAVDSSPLAVADAIVKARMGR